MILSKTNNNKGADQSVQMHRLVCTFVVRKLQRQMAQMYNSFYIPGKSMTITRTGQPFHLDWLKVFDVVKELPVTYSLIIGSQAMYTDILQKHYMTATHYNVDVPKTTIITENVNEIYFTITCSYSIGLSSTYRTSYKI